MLKSIFYPINLNEKLLNDNIQQLNRAKRESEKVNQFKLNLIIRVEISEQIRKLSSFQTKKNYIHKIYDTDSRNQTLSFFTRLVLKVNRRTIKISLLLSLLSHCEQKKIKFN